MGGLIDLTAREQEIKDELLAELFASLDVPDIFARTHDLLSQLVPSQHGALCVSRPEGLAAYDWAVAAIPSGFFEAYAAMVPHDFVRSAVAERPNVVLRDTEMLPRPEIERSFLYRHCRDVGMQLEHVMAVMLAEEGAPWHGGLILYRSEKAAFSDREQAILQHLARYFRAAVKSGKRFAELSRRGSLLEALLEGRGHEALVFGPSGQEIARTRGAAALFERWFSPSERGAEGLPKVLAERLATAFQGRVVAPPPEPWWRSGEGVDLRVTIGPLPASRGAWTMMMEEVPTLVPLPAPWRRILTAGEMKVAERVCWDNALIAAELGISEQTVKRHFTHTFDKLGLSSRAGLIHAAWRLR